jgi:hypothetical protein
MGITAISGPHVSFGITQGSTGQVQEYNEERGPDVSDLGYAAQDPRYYFNYKPGSPVGTKIYGFYETNAIVDFVPTTLQTSAILISSNAAITANTAMTLAAGSSALGTYTTTIVAPETGVTTGNLIAIDSTAAYLTFGSGARSPCGIRRQGRVVRSRLPRRATPRSMAEAGRLRAAICTASR